MDIFGQEQAGRIEKKQNMPEGEGVQWFLPSLSTGDKPGLQTSLILSPPFAMEDAVIRG